MSGTNESIPINSLHLHLKNPRCLFSDNENDALYELIADQGGDRSSNKLLALAEDISLNGLNAADLITVQPAKNGFVVREGNRRVAAIKCSLYPEIIPEDFKSLRKKFSDLSQKMPNEIMCYITNDEQEINHLINLKHNGQNGGRGTIPWNAEQRARFDEFFSGKPDKIISLIDYLVNYYGINSDEAKWLSKCKKTNLERMFSTPYIRKKLGFGLIGSSYKYIHHNDQLLSLFLERLSKINVGDIYYAKQRKQFMDRVLLEANIDTSNFNSQSSFYDNNDESQYRQPDDDKPHNAKDKENASSDSRHERADSRPKGYPENRKTVAPQSGSPLHTEGKAHLNQLHRELKHLIVKETPMACGLVFRTLIDEIVIYYLENQPASLSIPNSYSGRVQTACNILVADKNSGISNNDVDYFRKFAQNKDDIPVSLSSLHSIAHGEAGYPDPESLILLWDKIYLPLRAMLDFNRNN